MQITQISQDFSVSPQITTADVTEIANAGFKSIICNRPDFEEMANAISELPKPIFAYCRSGNRSSILFHAANG